MMVAAPAASAGEVSGRLVFCTGSDICRYFSEPRLEVTFQAAPGEANELRMVPDPDGVRIVDSGAEIVAGAFCRVVAPNDARCGPPAPEGLLATALTGDGSDRVIARVGNVVLGPGRDFGVVVGATVFGGSGDDMVRAKGTGAIVTGDAGADEVLGFGGDQYLAGGSGRDHVIGGPGADRIEAGRGGDTIAGGTGRDDISAGAGDDFVRASDPDRDVVRCGRGRDRVFIARRDRVFGCERITLGWDGRVVYPSALVSRLSSLQLLLLLPPRGE